MYSGDYCRIMKILFLPTKYTKFNCCILNHNNTKSGIILNIPLKINKFQLSYLFICACNRIQIFILENCCIHNMYLAHFPYCYLLPSSPSMTSSLSALLQFTSLPFCFPIIFYLFISKVFHIKIYVTLNILSFILFS